MSPPKRHGFTLIELLIVISIMAILGAIVLPSATPAVSQRLQAAAQVLASDLGYVRSLAVSNGSTYRVTIDSGNNRYVIEHSGTNASLDTLPPGPFWAASDPSTQHIVDLDSLPMLSRGGIQLAGVATSMGTLIGEVEFGPLGATTESDETKIWFTAGTGSEQRSIAVLVNPVTGLATVDQMGGLPTGGVGAPVP